MKYLFLIHLDEKKWLDLSETERQQIMAEPVPHLQQLIASGKFLGGAPLEASAKGATIRLRDGKPLVTDGPFAETREQVGGYNLIDAQDLDEAIGIAAAFLGTRSLATIEIRALNEVPGVPTH